MSDLSALQSVIDNPQFLRIGPGSTAELLDENDEQGWVVIKDAQGVERMRLPREVYEDIRRWKPLT